MPDRPTTRLQILTPVVTLSSFPSPCLCGENTRISTEGVTYYTFCFSSFLIVTFKRGFDIFLLLPSRGEGANNSADTGVCSPCDSSFSNHYLLYEQKNGLLTRLALRVSAEGTAFRCWVCGAQSCLHGRQTGSGPGQPYSAPAVLSQGSVSLLFE